MGATNRSSLHGTIKACLKAMTTEYQASRRGATLLLAVAIAGSANLTGCAHFCNDAYKREGAWGMVFRCSSRQRNAVPNSETPDADKSAHSHA